MRYSLTLSLLGITLIAVGALESGWLIGAL